MMKLNREDFLSALLKVEPGVSTQEVRRQSSCVVFRRGYVYSLNMEVACATPSGLEKHVDTAVPVGKLIELLKKLDNEEIDLSFEAGELRLKAGKARVVKIPLQDPQLPIDQVERPDADHWIEINTPMFEDAISMAVSCCSRSQKDPFGHRVLHLTPTYIEACDNMKLVRYQMEFPIEIPTLIRADSIKEIPGHNICYLAETATWLHLYNTDDLRISVRKLDSAKNYPNHDRFLAMRGKTLKLPEGIEETISLAMVFDTTIRLMLEPGKLTIRGKSHLGEFQEELEADCNLGERICFSIPAKLLRDLSKKHSFCEVTQYTLRIEGDNYVYVSSLGQP